MLIFQQRFHFFSNKKNRFIVNLFFTKKDDATPLYIAARNGHVQIVQILLEERGANSNLQKEVKNILFL